jgi:hypothetical protein
MTDTGETTAPRRQWSTIRWTRVSTALCMVLLCPALLIWFLEPWYFARQIGQMTPQLSVMPVPVPDTSTEPLLPKRLEYFEISFQVPWEQIETQKIAKTVAVLQFKDGGAMIVFDPTGSTAVSRGLRDQAKKASTVFGPRMMSSGYDWMAGEMAATPEQIRWWDRTGDVRLGVLLGLKATEILDCKAIYKVGNAELHGFQFCDPTAPPHRVKLDLFDVNNRRYEMVIASRDGKPAVTQADINAIVASMRPIPHG